MDTNFKAGTVVDLLSGGQYTLTGEAESVYGDTYFTLTNGGRTRLGNIAKVVSVPEPAVAEIGDTVTSISSGNSYLIEDIVRSGDDSWSSKTRYIINKGMGWLYDDELGDWTVTKKPELTERLALVAALNFATLKLAVYDGEHVEFDYKGADDDYAENRYISPTEIVGDGDDVRVVGYDLDDDKGVKSFRLDRIEGQVSFA